MEKLFLCCLRIAGVEIPCSFIYEDTEKYFANYVCESSVSTDRISVSEADWKQWGRIGGKRTSYAEYACSTAVISDRLLEYKRCIFHAVAFRDEEKAWLITAASGVGKTTQLRTLLELYPGKFSVICGDRPALQIMEDGSVFVHPTPWNGKENLYGAEGTVLQGIICLKRGSVNKIVPLPPRKAVLQLYEALIHSGANEENIRNVAAFENSLLKCVPVWELTNKGVPESTKLLYEKVLT